MAKRLIDWSLKGSVLEMRKYVKTESEEIGKVLAEFNIDLLFPEPKNFGDFEETDSDGNIVKWLGFGNLDKVQSFIFVYGLKQKLADCGSAEQDPNAKAILAGAKFQDFVDGKVIGERVNATGAKENKKIAESVKKVSGVVSLEGLMMKKIAFADTFTEEDQGKLDEFLAMVAKSKKVKK
jgi:hypothetical protein